MLSSYHYRSRTPEAVGLTGAGRAQRAMQGESFPLPAGGVFRVVQYLPPAGREMISLHPQCAESAGGREKAPARRAVFALPTNRRLETTQRLLKQNIGQETHPFWSTQIRSRTPEAVGLTGAGRAQRGMQGESLPLPAGGVVSGNVKMTHLGN
jgi:hypothetical protein